MNPEHHSINAGGGQPPGNSEVREFFFSLLSLVILHSFCTHTVLFQSQGQRAQAAQQQTTSLTPTTSATDLRVNSAVNVALSSVAKYWVFTNLFPGPIPQVSVYGLPTGARIENGKPQVKKFIVKFGYQHIQFLLFLSILVCDN